MVGLDALQEQQREALARPERPGDLAVLANCYLQDRAKPKLRDLHGHCDHVEHPVTGMKKILELDKKTAKKIKRTGFVQMDWWRRLR